MGSVPSLVGTLVVISFCVYIFAILLLSGVVEHFREVGADAQDDVSVSLRRWYGGLSSTTVTLFMVISGGVDWVEVFRPMSDLGPLYGLIFIAYVFFLYFGVLNVVMAAFVNAAAEVAAQDREEVVSNQLAKADRYRKKVEEFFKEADKDESGFLDWAEFEAHLQNEHVQAYFQSLDLDIQQAHILFELLDVDGNNQISCDEFLDGCFRLRGQARALDVNMMLMYVQKLFDKLHSFMQHQDEEKQRMQDSFSCALSMARISQRDKARDSKYISSENS